MLGGKQFWIGILGGLLLGFQLGTVSRQGAYLSWTLPNEEESSSSSSSSRETSTRRRSGSPRATTRQTPSKIITNPPYPPLTPPIPETQHCTATQMDQQLKAACDVYAGRHNLPAVFPWLRYYLPNATLLIDVGANKGLVSARWLELWRPQLGVTPQQYVTEHVGPSLDALGLDRKAQRVCGITHMCHDVNQTEREWLARESPIGRMANHHHDGRTDTFTVHSLEPSAVLYQLNAAYAANGTTVVKQTLTSFLASLKRHPTLGQHWQWHNIATSDENTVAPFPSLASEAGSLEFFVDGDAETIMIPTRVATLDTLALEDRLFDKESVNDKHNLIIDVLKIDAEAVDARVVVGARTLLQQQRIRVLMWETPNSFPLIWDNNNNNNNNTTIIHDFGQFMDHMDTLGLSCYFPGLHQRVIRLTACDAMRTSRHMCSRTDYCPYHQCFLQFSNVLCVHRVLAPGLYAALERQSLVDWAGDQ